MRRTERERLRNSVKSTLLSDVDSRGCVVGCQTSSEAAEEGRLGPMMKLGGVALEGLYR